MPTKAHPAAVRRIGPGAMSPSPFSSIDERRELERALLPPPPSSSSSSSSRGDVVVESHSASSSFPLPSSSPAMRRTFVPTAVPVSNVDGDGYYGCEVAMAEVAATMSSSSSSSTSTYASGGMASLPFSRWAIPDADSEAGNAANVDGGTLSSSSSSSSSSNDSRIGKDAAFGVVDVDDDVVVVPWIADAPPSSRENDDRDCDRDEYSRVSYGTADRLLPANEQGATTSGIRVANVRGKISCEEEIASVARGQRRAQYGGRHGNDDDDDATMVMRANEVGRARGAMYDEGLTVTDPPSREIGAARTVDAREKDGGKSGWKEGGEDDVRSRYGVVRDDRDGMRTGGGKGGYEVAEYNVSEYDTSEYDVSEYRSVYD